MKKNRLETRGY